MYLSKNLFDNVGIHLIFMLLYAYGVVSLVPYECDQTSRLAFPLSAIRQLQFHTLFTVWKSCMRLVIIWNLCHYYLERMAFYLSGYNWLIMDIRPAILYKSSSLAITDFFISAVSWSCAFSNSLFTIVLLFGGRRRSVWLRSNYVFIFYCTHALNINYLKKIIVIAICVNSFTQLIC